MFIDSRSSDVLKATLQTADFTFEGCIHVSQLGKTQRKISTLLNSDRRFIALTDVTVSCASTGKTEKVAFVQVNLNSVIYIQPHFDEESSQEED